MNTSANDKEREAAWERWNKMDSLHGGFTSKKDFDAGYCAALAHSEESVDSVTAGIVKSLDVLLQQHLPYENESGNIVFPLHTYGRITGLVAQLLLNYNSTGEDV